MSKSPKSNKDLIELWKKNPLINPKTNRTIIANGVTYKKLVKEFGIDPLTKTVPENLITNTDEFLIVGTQAQNDNSSELLLDIKDAEVKKIIKKIEEKFHITDNLTPKDLINIDGKFFLPKVDETTQTSERTESFSVPSQSSGRTPEQFFPSGKSEVSSPPVLSIPEPKTALSEKTRLEKFTDLAETLGFNVITVPFDGDCIWNAIGYFFNVNGITLRNFVYNYVNNSKYIEISENLANRIMREGLWIPEQELLPLLSDVLDIKICILSEETRTIKELYSSKRNSVFIGHLKDLLYVTLIPNKTINIKYSLPELTTTVVNQAIDLDEMKTLINHINDIKNFTRISTFMESETSLLKSVGLL
nr:MAG: major virion DNA-binding protein [Diabrotica toursvirus 3a]